jgi:hypothetical protein
LGLQQFEDFFEQDRIVAEGCIARRGGGGHFLECNGDHQFLLAISGVEAIMFGTCWVCRSRKSGFGCEAYNA